MPLQIPTTNFVQVPAAVIPSPNDPPCDPPFENDDIPPLITSFPVDISPPKPVDSPLLPSFLLLLSILLGSTLFLEGIPRHILLISLTLAYFRVAMHASPSDQNNSHPMSPESSFRLRQAASSRPSNLLTRLPISGYLFAILGAYICAFPSEMLFCWQSLRTLAVFVFFLSVFVFAGAIAQSQFPRREETDAASPPS